MKYNAFPEYKDSGVEWIGEIPKEWDVKKLKYLAKKIIDGTHNTPTYVSDGIPFLRVTDITNLNGYRDDIDWNNTAYIPEEEHIELIKRCNPQKGDLLVSKNGTIGVPRVVDWDKPFSIFVSLCLIKLNGKVIVNYLYYYFLSSLIWIEIAIGGKTGTITNLHLDKIREFQIPLPSLQEQKQITKFLDQETARIANIISAKIKLIEKLKEKRIAIISHAVTKGLDTNVKMKLSGIDWVGDIPEGWEVKKLKYMVTKVGSGVTPTGGATVYQDEGVPFLRSQNIYSDRLKLDDIVYISEEIDEQMSNSRILEGDVLLNITGASIGRCFYVPTGFGRGNVNQHVCIIRPINSKVLTKYLQNIIISQYGQGLIDVCQIGANREGLNFQQIKSFYFPLPSITEQRLINEHLDLEITRIDSIIAKAQASIEKLKEYQTSLISAAVTGKIVVPLV